MKKRLKKKLNKTDPKKNIDLYQQSFRYYQLHDLQSALDCLIQYYCKNKSVIISHTIAEMFFQEAFQSHYNTEDRLKKLNKAMHFNPNKINYLIWAGYYAALLKKFKKSHSFFLKATAIDARNSEAKLFLGYLSLMEKDNAPSSQTPHPILQFIKNQLPSQSTFLKYTHESIPGNLKPSTLFHLGVYFLGQQNFIMAKKCLTQAFNRGYQKSHDYLQKVYFMNGNRLIKAGKFRAALKYYEQLENKKDEIIMQNLALLYEKTDNPKLANDYWRKLCLIYKNNVNQLGVIYPKMAENAFNNNQIRKGLNYLEQAIQYRPSADLYIKYAVSLDEYGDEEAAVIQYKKYLSLKPNDSQVMLDLSYCLEYLDKNEEAIQWLRKAKILDPQNTHISDALVENIIDFAMKNNNIQKSIEMVQEVKALKPHYKPAYMFLIGAYHMINADQKMEVEIKETLKIYPKDPAIYAFLGDFLFLIQPKRAEKMIKAALQCGKKNSFVLSRIGGIFLRHSTMTKAKYYFDQAVAYSENPVKTCLDIGDTYNEHEFVLDYLEKAHTLEPESFETNIALGTTYMSFSFFSKAEKCLQKALSLMPPKDPEKRQLEKFLAICQEIS